MNILFIHQNFPGQFLHLAPALQARSHNVMALTTEANQRPFPVRTLRYRSPAMPAQQGIGRPYAEMAERGLVAARACAQIAAQEGFVPDAIVGHSGWGETLFLRAVWPTAKILTYAEFLYRATGLDANFDPEFSRPALPAALAVTARAAHLVQAMADTDVALAPTEWQAATFPPLLRQKIRVIHDGIDTDHVRPNPAAVLQLPSGRTLCAGDEVLSFVNRNLEPYRGYHVFLRALPEVMAARPDAQVVIVGGDGQSYGPAPESGTWKQRFLDEVSGRVDPARLHFLGRVPYPQFLALMQVTRVHAYLTYPFVLSWSMLEAMAAGALVVGSRTGPVEEVIRDGENGRLVDFFDVSGWSGALIRALSEPVPDEALRRAARDTIVSRYDLRRVCLPAQIALVEGLGAA